MVTCSCWPSRPGDTLISNEPHVNKVIGSLGPSLKSWREMFLQIAVAYATKTHNTWIYSIDSPMVNVLPKKHP